MSFIVFDLEWNQCPQGKHKENPKLPFEVIEIGAVRMNEKMQICDSFHELVKPKVYRTLHHMTRQVINITEKDLADKRSFPEVASDFFDWCGEDPVFCTWGPGDLIELERNLAFHKMPSPFPFPLFYYDIQKISSIEFSDGKTRLSLEKAVDALNIPKQDDFHDAYADALYTAHVCEHMSAEQLRAHVSVDYYRTPANIDEEIHLKFSDYTKFVSRSFSSSERAMADTQVKENYCPECGRKCHKQIPWFPAGSHNYLSVSTCPEHGLVKGKVRLRTNTEERVFAIKTQRLITSEDAEKLSRKNASAAKRAAMLARAAENGELLPSGSARGKNSAGKTTAQAGQGKAAKMKAAAGAKKNGSFKPGKAKSRRKTASYPYQKENVKK